MTSRRDELVRWAWLPIPAFFLAMIVSRVVNSPIAWEGYLPTLILNFVFSTLASFYIAYLIGRSFLVRGAPGLLLLGFGLVAWGAAGVVANAVSGGDPDLDVTIHNLGVGLAAFLHLAGAFVLRKDDHFLRARGVWLSAAYASTLGALGLIALVALHGYTPTFFVAGEGGTPVRQLVLGWSAGMFVVTTFLSLARRERSAFGYWYALALLAIAVGLLGILLQTTIGGLVAWFGRSAMYIGGVYMLLAAFASVHEANVWGLPLQESLQRANARLAEVLGSISDGFVAMDASWRYTYVNREAERIFGKCQAELLVKPIGRATLEELVQTAAGKK